MVHHPQLGLESPAPFILSSDLAITLPSPSFIKSLIPKLFSALLIAPFVHPKEGG